MGRLWSSPSLPNCTVAPVLAECPKVSRVECRAHPVVELQAVAPVVTEDPQSRRSTKLFHLEYLCNKSLILDNADSCKHIIYQLAVAIKGDQNIFHGHYHVVKHRVVDLSLNTKNKKILLHEAENSGIVSIGNLT